jgi:hypothetical protein
VETDLQPGQSVIVICDVEDDFPVTVIRRIGECRYCGLSAYRCRTPLGQEISLCRSAVLFPN